MVWAIFETTSSGNRERVDMSKWFGRALKMYGDFCDQVTNFCGLG